MKQILQSLKTGTIELTEIPCPQVKPQHLLIKTRCSLISAGTERMLLDFGRANFLEKMRQQPDKVVQVLNKIKTDGVMPTLEAVFSKLEQPIPLGYCNVGEVLEVGAGVTNFKVGDRVLSNGNHAEIVVVPKNLCVKIPEGITDECATFGVLGAIALQGIRSAKPELGESVAVFGLGLLGLLSVQLLMAQGCRVLGIDFDKTKLELARNLGAEVVDLANGADPIDVAKYFTNGKGIDAVIVTAASKSDAIMHQAAQMSRRKGRVILVGVVGLKLSRVDFYEKEISFQVSCSYGPGRYDKSYEQGGVDYPFGLVRWTAQRNFAAILDMIVGKRINPVLLISHRFAFAAAADAYQKLMSKDNDSLGIILEYAQDESLLQKKTVTIASAISNSAGKKTLKPVVVGIVGAGNYAARVLVPGFKATGAVLHSIASSGGITAVAAAKKYGFIQATTDTKALLNDPDINTIVIATQHNSHASLVCEALLLGKKVFVEKPLAITLKQLETIKTVYNQLRVNGEQPFLMVGFNRRFAPQVKKIKHLLQAYKEPKAFIMTVNAGFIPPEHWAQDLEVGGGRIIGEACHMIDLLRFLADSPATLKSVNAVTKGSEKNVVNDQVAINLEFADGSIGTVHYLSNGNNSFPKERLEIFCANHVLQLDNFRRLTGFGWPNFKKMNLWRQDKGNSACIAATVAALGSGEEAPIPFEELIEVSKLSIAANVEI